MNGGPIGGIKQKGEWLINARFNKPELQRRCEKIAEYRDRIHVSRDDGIEFVRKQDPSITLFLLIHHILQRERRFTSTRLTNRTIVRSQTSCKFEKMRRGF
jgi:hypothetical protein